IGVVASMGLPTYSCAEPVTAPTTFMSACASSCDSSSVTFSTGGRGAARTTVALAIRPPFTVRGDTRECCEHREKRRPLVVVLERGDAHEDQAPHPQHHPECAHQTPLIRATVISRV